ncbi:MAG TPA: DUF2007 domain-containing protein [Gaiellaceae bacterium]
MAEDLVRVAVAPNTAAAAIIAGMLRANGVECEVRQTNFGAGSMDGMPGGAQQILVRESDAATARALLDESS